MGQIASAENLFSPSPFGVRYRGQHLQFVCCFLSDLLDVRVEGQLLVQDYSEESWCWAEIDFYAVDDYCGRVICQLGRPGEEGDFALPCVEVEFPLLAPAYNYVDCLLGKAFSFFLCC